MDSLTSVSPSMVLPLPLRRRRVLNSSSFSANNRRLPPPRISSFSSASHPLDLSRRSSRSRRRVSCRLASGSGDGDRDAKEEDNSNDDGSEEVERALHLDGTIPGTSNEFVKQVSSRAYDMRRHLQQSFDSSSYDGSHLTNYPLLTFLFICCVILAFSIFCQQIDSRLPRFFPCLLLSLLFLCMLMGQFRLHACVLH